MPEILVDILKVKDLYSGLGQFSANFAQALIAARRTANKVKFLAPPGHAELISEGTGVVHPSLLRRYFPALNKPYDLWHSLHQFPSFHPHPRSKWILTVHDLNFLVEKDRSKAQRYLQRLQRNVDKSHAVTAISAFTKSELEKHVDLRGKPVHVIHNGVVMPSGNPTPKPQRPYFLSLGVFKEKKNFHVLLPILKDFPDHDLVLAGNNATPYGTSIKERIRVLGLEDRVQMPGAVEDQEKFRLFSNCDALLFPSLAEGFGLPVIEAMLLGKPVFLSRATSLPEIGGDAAFYFDSEQPATITHSIRSGLSAFVADPHKVEQRMKTHAAKFTWAACILKYIELYAEVLEQV